VTGHAGRLGELPRVRWGGQMPIERRFLGADRPALPAVVEFLVERFGAGSLLDLSGVVVVLPGARAGRRLRELLVARCQERDWSLLPPEITTIGRLPELLYTPQRPFADELVQRLAWAEALRTTDRARLAEVIRQLPDEASDPRWLELAAVLMRQHTELAGDRLDFADVARLGRELPGFDEASRWETLALVQRRYLETLDEHLLWDRQTARRVAIQRGECRCDCRLVLVGTTDMNRTLREMLDQVAGRVTSLVAAPEAWRDRFDEHGCVVPEVWAELPIDLARAQLVVADGPADQALAVVRCLARLEGCYRGDQITVGVADERLVPHLERQLAQYQVPARWGPGRPLVESPPVRLLQAVAAYLQGRRRADLAALVRHPDLERWLVRQGVRGDWLTQLDQYHSEHLPARLDGQWLGAGDDYEVLREVVARVGAWLRPLLGEGSAVEAVSELPPAPQPVPGGRGSDAPHCGGRGSDAAHCGGRGGDAARPAPGPEPGGSVGGRGIRLLGDWSQPLWQLLLDVYGDIPLGSADLGERLTREACRKIYDILQLHERRVPERLAPRVTAREAIEMTLDPLAAESVAPPADSEAVELLGWLELPLDDAPVLIVTSLNDALVPAAANSDLFLPGGLRSRLGLDDNRRRYARDACALCELLASRQDLSLIVGRRGVDGDPLVPSRLLLAADPPTVAQRVRELLRPAANASAQRLSPLVAGGVPPRDRSDFEVPRPRPLDQPIVSLRVTDFRAYLACPYRFYLERVLRLEEVRDDDAELDGAAFGTLVHEVLQQFGSGPDRDSTDADQVAAVLDQLLQDVAVRHYGRHGLPSVQVQVEQLRYRLRGFAVRQAEWAARGWRIEHTEVPTPDQRATLMVDGEPLELRGRIDRIDRHLETGQRAILDYKSSDTASTPAAVHIQKHEWIDLQLPLYRHLARVLGIEGPVQLGYVLLPKDIDAIAFRLAEWTDDQLREADEMAFEVVRRIRREEFWPPKYPPPDYAETFAAICQDHVYERQRSAAQPGGER